ncbi:glycosyltransferase [Rhizobium sp. BK251]|uniref:glycosyltransferase n=1 Tax=Rhizobium sp. BK251 TaxID=2512125 RepID=UPI001048160F|nr:glycosyltransferase [Rhizobium sp. BK251]TCL75628.1 glycosyl transferase family 1 [Rhizobium sp. BK251]
MKVLHITPHLGGGVGKAHASIQAAGAGTIERTYFLLEEPRDRRFASMVEAAGARLVFGGATELRELVDAADIVQIEWWNHPRLYECLSQWQLPPMRSVFWAHVSGLSPPFLPERLAEAADRLLFTSPCSLAADNIVGLPHALSSRLAVVNSGFGYEGEVPARTKAKPVYLGTVDFVKMHPAFFDVLDSVDDIDFKLSIWGQYDADGEPLRRAARMRHPQRVVFEGQHPEPRRMLEEATILVYLLRPDHYGTAENVLVEAMSLGVVPLVFGNPAERAIVKDGETGLVASDEAEAAAKLAWMLRHPEEVARIGAHAAESIRLTHRPDISAADLERCYRPLLHSPKRSVDFGRYLGTSPVDWFLSTQRRSGTDLDPGAIDLGGGAAKGSVAHFLACFPNDAGLLNLQLRAGRQA